MKLNSLLYFLLITMISISSARASTKTLSSTLTINVNFFAPSCDVKVPSEYDLGSLTPGNKIEHKKINIEISCIDSYSYSTGLIASVRKGTLDTFQTSVQMLTNDEENGPFLSLKDEGGTLIKMTGNKSDAFCIGGDKKRICSITPISNVPSDAISGRVIAVINFSIIYS
ncbi:hypothetical protein ACV4SA_003029 [Escherichia coli]|nr:hypothetical protein [Escherichia coli]HBV7368787.1 hypothetical protein [Escherichia coli]